MDSRWLRPTALCVLGVFTLSACATFGPPGPSMPAYIGHGKTQAQFDADDVRCRQLATARAGDPAQVQQNQAASAAVGTLLGAAAGAALGGAIGGGRGAGIGAAAGGAAGLSTGLGVGTVQAQHDVQRIQQRWDAEYYSCMYAAGHQVPGGAMPAPSPAAAARGPAVTAPPPPPPPPAPPAASAPAAAPAALGRPPSAVQPPPPGSALPSPSGAVPSTSQTSMPVPPGPDAPCTPTGKYVKTAQGFVPECERGPHRRPPRRESSASRKGGCQRVS